MIVLRQPDKSRRQMMGLKADATTRAQDHAEKVLPRTRMTIDDFRAMAKQCCFSALEGTIADIRCKEDQRKVQTDYAEAIVAQAERLMAEHL